MSYRLIWDDVADVLEGQHHRLKWERHVGGAWPSLGPLGHPFQLQAVRFCCRDPLSPLAVRPHHHLLNDRKSFNWMRWRCCRHPHSPPAVRPRHHLLEDRTAVSRMRWRLSQSPWHPHRAHHSPSAVRPHHHLLEMTERHSVGFGGICLCQHGILTGQTTHYEMMLSMGIACTLAVLSDLMVTRCTC